MLSGPAVLSVDARAATAPMRSRSCRQRVHAIAVGRQDRRVDELELGSLHDLEGLLDPRAAVDRREAERPLGAVGVEPWWERCATRARRARRARPRTAAPTGTGPARSGPGSGRRVGPRRCRRPTRRRRTRGSTRRRGSGRERRPTPRRSPRPRRRRSSPGAAPDAARVPAGACAPAVGGSEAVEEHQPRHQRNEPEHSSAIVRARVVDQPVTFPAELRHRLAVEVVCAARWRSTPRW